MSKVIAAERLGGCRVVKLPEVGSGDVPHGPPPVTVEDLEALQREAQEEGYAQGHQDGYAAGREQAAKQAARLAALADTLAAPLAEVDERVIDEVAHLAIALARHMIRRELKTDPGQVVAIVGEAVACLPVAAQQVRLQLHPEDARLVRDALSLDGQGGGAWEIVEAPTMTRGGCIVATDKSQIDATVETRFSALVARLMGGEREHDRPQP